jgi:diamine N-acetyltransferase
MPEVPYSLRECQPGDEAILSLLGTATFLESFADLMNGPDILLHCSRQHSAEKYRTWLGANNAAVCVVEVNRAPVGYAVMCPPDLPVAPEEGDIELKRIYLFHRFQSRGMGRALMQWCIEQAEERGARRMLLGVHQGNAQALAFYERHGFTRIATRRFTVGTLTYDDAVMSRAL